MACWVRPESRFLWIHIQKNLDSGLPGLADQHLRENTVFPDLLISISRKRLSSRTCRSASQGKDCLPGLADRHLGETTGFPEKLFHDEFFAEREKYFGLRSSRRAASARLPPVFRSALSMIAFLQAFRLEPGCVRIPTVPAIPKSPCSITRSPGIWKHSLPGSKNVGGTSRSLSSANCARSSNAESWPADFCVCGARRAARISCCLYPVRVVPSVRPVADAAWPIPPRILSTVCFPMCPSGSGFSPCRLPCAIVWLTTRK